MSDKQWLAELKVGDKFTTWERWNGHEVWRIERITATQFVADNGRRFNRETGREIGGGRFATQGMEQLTAEIAAKIRVRRAEGGLRHAVWENNPHAIAVWEYYQSLKKGEDTDA